MTKTYKIDKVNIVYVSDPAADQFAREYTMAERGDYKPDGPTAKDEKAAQQFQNRYTEKSIRGGVAGSGSSRYTDNQTGEVFVVRRQSNGNTFYGTDHIVSKQASDVDTPPLGKTTAKFESTETKYRVTAKSLDDDSTFKGGLKSKADADKEADKLRKAKNKRGGKSFDNVKVVAEAKDSLKLNELSPDTLRRYRKKASDSLKYMPYSAQDYDSGADKAERMSRASYDTSKQSIPRMNDQDREDYGDQAKRYRKKARDIERKMINRTTSIARASKKIYGESQISESVLDDVDDDGFMAKRQLYDLAKYSVELHRMIQDTDNLEPWIQAKITKAADYIDTVKHYMEYNQLRDAEDTADVMGPPEMDDIDVVDTEINSMIQREEEIMEYGDEAGTQVHPEDVLHWASLRGIISQEQYADPEIQLLAVADDIAEHIGEVTEVGSSDVSIWMRQFVEMARSQGIQLDGDRAHVYESETAARRIYESMLRELRKAQK